MNFVKDLAPCGVFVGQWLEHRKAESEGLRLDSSWGLRTFSLSHACDKTKKAKAAKETKVIEVNSLSLRTESPK